MAVGVAEGDAVAVAVGVGLAVAVGVGVAGAQLFTGEEEFRGFGAPAAKSPSLLSVSVQPPLRRRSAVVVLGAGARPDPSKQLAVVP